MMVITLRITLAFQQVFMYHAAEKRHSSCIMSSKAS